MNNQIMESVATQIDMLEVQVNRLAGSANSDSPEMRCQRVEELMSLYVSLLERIDQAVESVPENTRWSDVELDRWVPWYKHHASLGAKIRDQMRSVRSAVSQIRGLDEFMSSFIAARAGADTREIMAASAALEAGITKTRPIEDLLNELSRRNDASSRSDSSFA